MLIVATLPDADFAEVVKVSYIVNARSLGAMLNTPNRCGRVTRSKVGEEVRNLEDRLGRGGVEDHFLGGEKGVVGIL